MGYSVIYGFFRFWPKMNFHFCFIFRFRCKMSFALGWKCYIRNWTITKLCDIGTFVFVFRPLHQTVSDYTISPWFKQSRFRTGCRCLEKLVLPSIFDTIHPSSSSSPPSSSSRSPSDRGSAPWPLTISDLHSVDSSRALASS